MSDFSLKKELPSVDLSIEAVSELERYVTRTLSDELDISMGEVRSQLKVSITDELGTETLETIEDFIPLRFRDSTQDLEIKLYNYKPDTSLRLSFSRRKTGSTVSFSISTDSPGEARRKVAGMIDGIQGILETRKNLNHLLWTGGLYFGFAFVSTSLLGSVIPWEQIAAQGKLWLALPSAALLIAGIWFPVFNEMKEGAFVPYVHFDTQRYNRIRAWAAEVWLILLGTSLSGLVGAIL